jgi:uncharacterized protein YidB (DUF937 family)
MSWLDDLSTKLQAKYGAGAEGHKVAAQALKMIDGLDNGMDGLVAKFEKAGLKEQAQSWVSKGKNLPVTAAQVKAALGPELEKYAQKMDMTVDAAAAKMAEVMPDLVDKLTPDGIAPKVAELKQNVGQLVTKLTHKDAAPKGPGTPKSGL